MSEELEESSEVDEGGGEEEAPPKKRFGLKTILMFGVPVLLLLAGGGYFLFFSSSSTDSAGATKAVKPAHYFDLPEMVVNLSAREKRAQYLKIKVSLEAQDPGALDALKPVMPRVLDMFQVYLRELRSSDLEGSAGIFRLKEELLHRVNLSIHPSRVDRVLFKEIIIQ